MRTARSLAAIGCMGLGLCLILGHTPTLRLGVGCALVALAGFLSAERCWPTKADSRWREW